MNSFSIAYNNFKHNMKTYALHLMAMIFSVAIYYNFILFKYNPQITQLKSSMDAMRGSAASASVLLLVFLIFFIWFSNSFFLNQKKKEMGIYAFAGLDNYKIGFIFAIESFLLGLAAITIGMIVGILFSKLFNMLLVKVAYLSIKLKFFISLKAVGETIITFLIVFLIISLIGYFNIVKSKLIDLFNASKKHEGLPKINYIKAVGSIFILGTAYIMCAVLNKIAVVGCVPIITILTIWGTYWLFGAFFSMIMKYAINKKEFLYKGVNIISMSNIAFRIKGNYRTLATIAILIASSITAFGTVTSIKYSMGNLALDLPYSFTYISDDKDNTKTEEKVHEAIKESNHNILLKEKSNFILVDKVKVNYSFNHDNLIVLKVSDFKDISKKLKVEDYDKLMKKSNLSSGKCIYIERPKVMMSAEAPSEGRVFQIDNLSLKSEKDLKTPLFGGGLNDPVLVVNDLDYEKIKPSFKQYEFNGIIVDNQENTLDLSMELRGIDNLGKSLYSFPEKYRSGYEPYGIIFFMGSILALVFVIATGSIIHFKVLSEAFMDKAKYDILIKLGITERELTKSISNQVSMYFILPVIVGVIHSCAAILILSRLMDVSLIIPTIISIVTFIAIYGIFYIFTVRKFEKIIL